MTDDQTFPTGTIVTLKGGEEAGQPSSFRPGDELMVESGTQGKFPGRVVGVTPETLEVESATRRYSLTPAAATLASEGRASYDGAWVIQSVVEI